MQASCTKPRKFFGYRCNNNHFPVQNFYLQDVVKDDDGVLTLKTVATVLKDAEDNFAKNAR